MCAALESRLIQNFSAPVARNQRHQLLVSVQVEFRECPVDILGWVLLRRETCPLLTVYAFFEKVDPTDLGRIC